VARFDRQESSAVDAYTAACLMASTRYALARLLALRAKCERKDDALSLDP
jgi:hypothetical protein